MHRGGKDVKEVLRVTTVRSVSSLRINNTTKTVNQAPAINNGATSTINGVIIIQHRAGIHATLRTLSQSRTLLFHVY